MAEGWRDTLAQRVLHRPGRTYRLPSGATYNNGRPAILPGRDAMIQIRASHELIAALSGAARSRNVSRSTYIRRHLAVAIAADTGADPRALLATLPKPVPFGSSGGSRGKSADDGVGLDDWCTHPGCDGAHLL